MDKSLDILWTRIQAGDENAFDMLFKELYPALLHFAAGIIKKLPDAEETVEDSFINLWNNRNKIEIKASVKAYLYQTIHNLALNKLEHFRSKKFLPNNSIVENEQWEYLRNSFVVDDSLIEIIESKDIESQIKKAVENLPAKCREIFILSRYENLNYEEISDRLKISENTVRVQIFRALKVVGNLIGKK